MHRGKPTEGPRVNLYPDLKEFYSEGVVETGSSIDLPIDGLSRLVPSAPLPSEPDRHLDLLLRHTHNHNDTRSHNHNHRYHHGQAPRDLQAPEEPELDYTLDIEPDYDLDDVDVEQLTRDNLNLQGQGDLRLNLNLDGPDDLNLNNLNLNAAEKKILHDKNIEVPRQPRDTKDFRAWMTWRLQANKLLAAVILIRKGHQVRLRKSEMQRRPLTQQNVQTIVREARGGSTDPLPRDRAERTSLTGCPYIMYGIPRVKLSTTSTTTATTSSGKR